MSAIDVQYDSYMGQVKKRPSLKVYEALIGGIHYTHRIMASGMAEAQERFSGMYSAKVASALDIDEDGCYTPSQWAFLPVSIEVKEVENGELRREYTPRHDDDHSIRS